MAASADLAAPLYAALIGDAGIASSLAAWEGAPAVFTNRPVPAGAPYPLIICAGDVSRSDQDLIADPVQVIVRDVSIYGQNTTASGVNQTRTVESLALKVRDLFHRQRNSIVVPGWSVMDIVAQGPMIAPTDDDQTVGRLVTLTIRLT